MTISVEYRFSQHEDGMYAEIRVSQGAMRDMRELLVALQHIDRAGYSLPWLAGFTAFTERCERWKSSIVATGTPGCWVDISETKEENA